MDGWRQVLLIRATQRPIYLVRSSEARHMWPTSHYREIGTCKGMQEVAETRESARTLAVVVSD